MIITTKDELTSFMEKKGLTEFYVRPIYTTSPRSTASTRGLSRRRSYSKPAGGKKASHGWTATILQELPAGRDTAVMIAQSREWKRCTGYSGHMPMDLSSI